MFNRKEVGKYQDPGSSPVLAAKFNSKGFVKYEEPQSPVSNRSMPMLTHGKSEGNFFLEKVNQRANIFKTKRIEEKDNSSDVTIIKTVDKGPELTNFKLAAIKSTHLMRYETSDLQQKVDQAQKIKQTDDDNSTVKDE